MSGLDQRAAAASQAVTTTGGAALVKRYGDSFTAVLPSHLRGATWLRVAQAALKRGKPADPRNPGGPTELEVAANNNPPAFLAALLDAARLGLEPGTESFYLIPRRGPGGKTYVQGIVGYQGLVELMYRAGAVTSVVAVVVHERDRFEYVPGRDRIPLHEVDWDLEDRGRPRLVYAYAFMGGGAVSQVVVLNRADIDRIKATSAGASSTDSPWRKHEASMWLKSAVRQLAKWVPTSAEYVRIHAEADAIRAGAPAPGPVDIPDIPAGWTERTLSDVVDAELEDDTGPIPTEVGNVDPDTGEVLP